MDQDQPLQTPPTVEQAKALRRKLLAWYRKDHRAMPWRAKPGERPNPYHTLVSEAMLQQTQVATVIPYFERFMAAFPTVHALADADEQQVLTLWQGLGYYRRARNLHAAAKAIVRDYHGEVPRSVIDLRQLPGIGAYTAGAIASIAHGTQAAVVDGNVERVFARLMRIEEPINAPATKKKLWAIAEPLVPQSNPGDYNQAVMELGAMICTPKVPKCFVCPLRTLCRAVQETDPQTLPIKLAKKKPKAVTHLIFAIERKGKYLIEQRPKDGLWSSMWQLPTWEQPADETESSSRATREKSGASETSSDSSPACYTAATQWFHDRFGLTIDITSQTTEFTHQTTHRTIRFVVLRAAIRSGRLKPNTGIWRGPSQLDGLPMSNPQRQVIHALGQ